MKCIIVDDEQPARELLKQYVGRIEALQLVADCKSSMEAMEALRRQKVDLIFQDIQLPDLKGTDFIKTLPYRPAVILTTAYAEHALEGYELDVVDYLLKPIAFERFVKAVNKVLNFERKMPAETGMAVPNQHHLVLKADHRLYRVAFNDILYIEGLREYVTCFTKTQKIVTLAALKKLESELPDDQFVRIHKSYIVNINKVSSWYENQLEVGDVMLPIGKTYREKVQNLF